MGDTNYSRHYGRWSVRKDCCQCGGPLLIWMVIDEDTAAYGGRANQGHCGCYESEDTYSLEKIYREYPLLRNTTVCNRVKADKNSAASNYRDIWQVNANPPNVRFRDWDRPPTLDRIKQDFRDDIERFKNWNEKLYFYTIVDNSGSMTTSTVQPAWGQFLTWLDTEFSQEDDRFVKVHTNSSGFPERWILFVIEQMEKYVEEMQIEPEPEPPPFGAPESMAFGVTPRPDIDETNIFLENDQRNAERSDYFAGSPNGAEAPIKRHPRCPETHDVTAWRNYHGPYCKWMRDTGVMAPGNCLSHFVECENPKCPISQALNNGTKPAWKTRFCNPTNCRFFEW